MRTNDVTYTSLVAMRDKLELQHSKLKSELAEIARKLQSVSDTLEMLDDDTTEASNLESEFATIPSEDGRGESRDTLDLAALRGLTQLGALRKIAQHNDGILVTSTAKRLLLQAGLIKTPKNANNIMFQTIARSGQFHRVSPGVYQLGGLKPERPSIFGERE